MTIHFKARVLLELGAELISSDGVALYELVKNGIDAGSPKITVDVRMVLQPSARRRLEAQVAKGGASRWDPEAFRTMLEEALEPDASEEQVKEFMEKVGRPSGPAEALEKLRAAEFAANVISISDKGSGMSLADLETCYLTIGTPSRLLERQKLASDRKAGKPGIDSRIPLGEKGIGRLAAMRIGHHVTVLTGCEKETRWNELVLDWRPIFDDPNLDAADLSFRPRRSGVKDGKIHGTTIAIRDIQSDWTRSQLFEMGKGELTKLKDPFGDDYANKFLEVHWQGSLFKELGTFQSKLLVNADASCSIAYRVGSGELEDAENGPRLAVSVNYRLFGKTREFIHEGSHLMTLVSYEPGRRKPSAKDALPNTDEVIAALASLGDFDAEFHWFNRGRIMREDKALWDARLRDFVRTWSGGLLVYRDSYRVYPYGAPSDDWLDLDRKALSSSAYKLNRQQIVGYLRISSEDNPRLQDQTNREGFRDCPEKEALRRLLRQSIISDCKTFLESVDRLSRPADEATIADLQRRIDDNQRAASKSLKKLQTSARLSKDESNTLEKVIGQLKQVEDAWERAKEALSAHQDEIERYIHLAGVGLMVELIAHELARGTQSALDLLSQRRLASNPAQITALEAQMKTLNKRIRVLDELSIPGRQTKSKHDLSDIISMLVELYSERAERNHVRIIVRELGKKKLKRRVERGQILQILDNLLNNAFYWLARRLNRGEPAQVTIETDADAQSIRITDNGPGIPVSVGHQVFEPFYTTKPVGDGRGLGLYIAKRLAMENEADLTLLPTTGKSHSGFVLSFNAE